MGQLVNGVWRTDIPLIASDSDGEFRRKPTVFRDWITADGAPGPSGQGGFRAEPRRYHLYIAWACPWAHRTVIFRRLKGLEDLIGLSAVHPEMLDDGWTFRRDDNGATGDRLYGLRFARDLYVKADPDVTCRVTVPILWDRWRETIVSNESSEIIRMLNSAFDGLTGDTLDLWPEDLRDAIEPVNARIYDTLNNGVYRAGFATSQSAYERAVLALFDTLDWLDARLSSNRYLMGDRITEADWRLFTTLVRFDLVYFGHFKCNRRRLVDYPNLWAYARELYQWPGVAGTVKFPDISRHYHYSHAEINPRRVIPIGPDTDWDAPHGRSDRP